MTMQIVQFIYCLFTYKLNSPEANYKVSRRRKTTKHKTNEIKNKEIYVR
jgi:hypothetical protein